MNLDNWRLLYANSAGKDLRRLDPPIRARIVTELERLAQAGPADELVRLKGRAGSRLRVGDWRVLVELNREDHMIVVKRVLPRGRAYDR